MGSWFNALVNRFWALGRLTLFHAMIKASGFAGILARVNQSLVLASPFVLARNGLMAFSGSGVAKSSRSAVMAPSPPLMMVLTKFLLGGDLGKTGL